MNTVRTAAPYFADEYFLHERTEDDETKNDFGVRRSIARENVRFFNLGDIVKCYTESYVEVNLKKYDNSLLTPIKSHVSNYTMHRKTR